MKRSAAVLALLGIAFGVAVAARRKRNATDPALRALDNDFHAAYDRLRSVDARVAPVLVRFDDSLILFRGDQRTEFPVTAVDTQLLKAAAHVPIGIFVTLIGSCEARLDGVTAARLCAMRDAQARAHDGLQALDPSTRSDVEAVLEASRGFLEQVLSQQHANPTDLSRFAAAMGPWLLRLTEHATRIELASLHAATAAALANLSADERQQLEVVVAGVHQARARSLALQYFQKRLGEAPGEEKRVAYAEAASDAAQARELVGTRRVDRAIALAFFGDAKRLQRDVLGDAAAQLIEHAALGPIS